MKHSSKFLLLSILSITLFAVSCSSVKGLFSKGQDDLKKANDSWKAGDELQALVYATNSLIIDPEFFQGKTFVKDRYDPALTTIKQRLNQIDKPNVSKVAEEKYSIYSKLVALNDNLNQIKLPIKHPKGKWSWTTTITDYKPQKEEARTEALNLLMADGRNFVSQNKFQEAQSSFDNAVNNYTIDINQRNSYKTLIAGELCEKAYALLQTTNIDQAILSNSFFKTAKHFVNNYQTATDGITKSASHVSNLYIQQGEQLENTANIDKIIESVTFYNNAIKWENSANAKEAQQRATTKIAEYYYQLALTAEKAKDNAKAIANLELVRKWIPEYKDSMTRIYNLRIGGKIEELAKNLKTTNTTFGKFQTRVNTVSGLVDKSADVMGKVTYISDKSRSVNQTMKTTSTTLKTFSIIPVVGTTTNILGKTVDVAQGPINSLVNKFDAIEKPVITPTKEVVDNTKSVVDNVKSKMASTSTVLKTTSDYSLRLKECVAKLTEEAKYQEAEKAIDEINKGLNSSNKSMTSMDNSLVKVETEGKKISDMASSVSKVANGFEDVSKAVSKIQPVVDKLNSVLDEKFGVTIPLVGSFKYSARDILNGVGGVAKYIMDKLSDLVMMALKPVLNQFNISIPSIPGIDQLKAKLDNFKGSYDVLNAEISGLKSNVTEYVNAQALIQTNLTKLEKAVGCEIAPASK